MFEAAEVRPGWQTVARLVVSGRLPAVSHALRRTTSKTPICLSVQSHATTTSCKHMVQQQARVTNASSYIVSRLDVAHM